MKFKIFSILTATLALPFLAAAQPYAYVANSASRKVSIVDRNTNTMTGTIVLAAAATGLDVTPSGAYLYTAAGNSVAVVNLSTNAVKATIALPGVSQNVTVSPNGLFAYVTLPAIGKVGIIDTTTNKLVTTLAAGDHPWLVAFNPTSTRAYVAAMYSGTVFMIDTATKTVTGSFASGGGACALAVSLDGTTVYVGNAYASTLTVHSDTGTLLATLPVTKPTSIALSPTGDRLYATSNSKATVSVFDTATLNLLNNIPVGTAPTWVAVSSTRAYVANQNDFTMSIADTVNEVVLSTLTGVGAYPVAIALGK